jgi:eukaryotic-like serine/threonine-protein kinase
MRTLPAAISTLVAEPERLRKLGQFVLVKQLGRGGAAPVWLAREEYAGRELREVAIKLFSLEASEHEPRGSVERVLEEARTLCRVEHPNIVRFHSVAIDASRRVAGFAMEHLQGRSLDAVLDEGKLSVPEVVDVGFSVASALSVVHRAGIVHRDVKPANIIETGSGYKLIDFGIARGGDAPRSVRGANFELPDIAISERGAHKSSVTVRSVSPDPHTLEVELAAGTMGYIDPECLQHASAANPQSDLYSLGATLFELATGRLPAAWDGKVMRGDVMGGRKRPPRLDELDPGIDADFAELVHQLLAPTREGRPSSAEWVVSKLERLRRALAGRDRPLPPEAEGPFRGLSRFEARDRGVYFGRSLEVAQALQVLQIRGFVALLGPSGSGKSSLASAGLLPAIEDGSLQTWPAQWDTLSMTPGVEPQQTLLKLLQPFLALSGDPSQADLLSALGRRAELTGRGIALLIDQLEEVATVATASSRNWIAEFIALSAEQAVPGFRVVVTARRDLLDPLLELSALGRALLKNGLLVEPMGSDTWAEVLDQALAAYGYRCEDEALRDELVSEIEGTASAMPLVGFALSRLWQMRDRERKVVTREALGSLGGIAGALAQHAQGVYDALIRRHPEQAPVVRRTLLALTTARGTRTTKSDAALRELAGDGARSVIQAFERAHLLVRFPNGLTIAHEVLIGKWQLLRTWVSEAQEARGLAEELEDDAARRQHDPDGVPLWPRRRLLAMADVQARSDVNISRAAQQFLEASRGAERRRRLLVGGLLAGLLTLASGGVFAYLRAITDERGNTERALQGETKSRKLAEQRAREVEAAQQRIDELLRNVSDSPTKDAVLELQRQIRATTGAPAPRPQNRPALLAKDAPSAAPVPAVPAAAPAASAPRIKVQEDW